MSQTSIIPESKNAITPSFYKSMGGSASISRTNGGLEVGATLIPIIKIVKEEIPITSAGQVIDIAHNLGQIYEVFIRYKVRNSTSWQMFYLPDFIDAQKVRLTFTETPSSTPYVFQLFFTLYKL